MYSFTVYKSDRYMRKIRSKVTDITANIIIWIFERSSYSNRIRIGKILIWSVYKIGDKESLANEGLPETKEEAYSDWEKELKRYTAERSKLSKILE